MSKNFLITKLPELCPTCQGGECELLVKKQAYESSFQTEMDDYEELKKLQGLDQDEITKKITRATLERSDFVGTLRDGGQKRKCPYRSEF